MSTNPPPRVDDDLILRYLVKDENGIEYIFTEITVEIEIERPDGSTTDADSISTEDMSTYNVEAKFSASKMSQVGWHRVQIKMSFNDGAVRHSEIDRFYVADNIPNL